MCFSIFEEHGQVGEIGPKYPKSWAPLHRKSFIVLNFTFHITNGALLKFKSHLRVNLYLLLCICKFGANWGNLAQIPQIMGRNTQKVIQSVKFHISHQMKFYSRVKAIWGVNYTCFNTFGELGRVRQIGP